MAAVSLASASSKFQPGNLSHRRVGQVIMVISSRWTTTHDHEHVCSIDREFVTSAKKSRILTNFPKLKKIRTKIR